MSGAQIGCARCFGADAAAAWEALHTRRIDTLMQESHFSVHIEECGCGQRFVVVFTERIDWKDGEDPQDWLALPLLVDELASLPRHEGGLAQSLAALGRARRFLVRSFPTGGELGVWWQEGGFTIGPHD